MAMIAEVIKKQILARLQEKNLNISNLEKKAGLPKNSVRNIMLGTSNNPGIVSLEAIAKVLECSIDELIGKVYKADTEVKAKSNIEHKWVRKLFYDILDHIANYIEKMDHTLSMEKILFLIKESYTYSLERNKGQLDKKFVEWLIEKNVD